MNDLRNNGHGIEFFDIRNFVKFSENSKSKKNLIRDSKE